MSYPEDDRWSCLVVLAPGINEFEIRGRTADDDWADPIVVTVELKSYAPTPYAWFNPFDEHAFLPGLSRNPGEKNWQFRNRILDHAAARTGAHIEGLFHALSIEMGVKPVEQALGVRLARDVFGNLASANTYFEITPVYLYVEGDALYQTREAHQAEPRWRGFELDYVPRSPNEVDLYTQDDVKINQNKYTVDSTAVTFKNDDYNGEWVTAHYPYRARIDHRSLTIDELITQIGSITSSGQEILECSTADGMLSAIGLMQIGRQPLTRNWTYVSHSNVRVVGLDNLEYQYSLLNRYGGAYDTKLERAARIAVARSNIGWDNLMLDEGLWDVETENRALDFLPRLMDPVFGRWFCTDPGCTRYFDRNDYRKFNGVCPEHEKPMEWIGTNEKHIKTGVAAEDSLYTAVKEILEEL